jgi:penicillin G amidase
MSTTPTTTPTDEYPVPGLGADVEVLVDRWGVPHVYAGSRLDAFVAQGFQAARDRLFQIDLWRRRGLGRLSEVLGPRHLAQDRATRLFLYRGDMRAEWLSYGTATQDVVTAFVTGVNAYVDWASRDPDRLPPEFGVLGYGPARWSPEDVVRIRTHGLLYNAEQELSRALTLRDLGPDAEELRSVREPAGPLELPEDGLYDSLSDAVLDTYRLAFAPADLAGAGAPEGSTPSGSNNWVIAPWRSGTGLCSPTTRTGRSPCPRCGTWRTWRPPA